MNSGRNETGKGRQEFSLVEDERRGLTRRFTLKGRVTSNEAAVIERALERAAQSGCDRIVINMSLVSMFSSAGIRVVLAMYKKLKKTGGELKIEDPSENVRNVIGMTALDELLLR